MKAEGFDKKFDANKDDVVDDLHLSSTRRVERIENLLADIRHLSEERHAIVQQVRELVLSTAPGISEEVKYGGILFSADTAFCGVFSYTRHVSLELSEGTRLPDPHGVLEGGGKHRRHIKLREPTDIVDKHVREYVEAAYADDQA